MNIFLIINFFKIQINHLLLKKRRSKNQTGSYVRVLSAEPV